jgi:asparagine synthase (glutamine-hydrolysing)
MCGITGIYAYRNEAPPVDREELLRIRERMVSRGPDGAGLWLSEDQRIGLAHRRLSIIDLSDAGAQPMMDADTGNQIVFNGEIYNHPRLRRELEATGQRFRSHSDTEVLLKLYAQHGTDMVHKLRGMYAFAICDARRQALFIARDPFGIKPLYLADDGKTLRFASQVRALLAGGGVETQPEPAGHVGFFLWGCVPEPFTLYKAIRAFPAGTSLWIERNGRKEETRFFDLTQEFAQPFAQHSPLDKAEAHKVLRAALLDSVRHHLVADVPVGLFLSAGLDSATLLALARECRPAEAPLNTVTLAFREFVGTPDDEAPLAETLARHYRAQHRTQWVQRQDFADQLDALLDAMDQPSIDGVNSYFVCRAASEAGLKVALSGLGGDEIFAGYSHFQNIPRMVRWVSAFSALPWLGRSARYLLAPLLRHTQVVPKAAGLLEYGGDFAGAYLLRRGLFMPWELPDVLDAELIKEGWRELQTLPALNATIQSLSTDRARISSLESCWYMRNQLLRDTDWAGMAHGVEVRVPLVDVDLFRTVQSLAAASYPVGKQELAATPAEPLPATVIERPKTGFSVPVREWLIRSLQCNEQSRGLRPWAECLMSIRRVATT